MEKIRAFVGHSFTANDEIVVNKFLDFFDHIKGLQIPFEWENAKKAEPEELSKKVLQLMEDKNTFIGICTKKERVLIKENPKPIFWNSKVFRVRENDFIFKTSDWIIQEIGFAFGRGMKIILLLEEGIKKPGGLQGNLEYIEFNRLKPEESFTKITEMIQKLLPVETEEVGRSLDKGINVKANDQSDIEKANTELKEIVIQPPWDEFDYDEALFKAILLRQMEKENEIIESYNKTVGLDNLNKQNSFLAKSYYYLYVFRGDNTFNKMKKLLEDDPNNSEIYDYLGKLYQKTDDYNKAQEQFKVAFEKTDVLKNKLIYLSQFMIALVKNGGTDYLKYFEEMINLDSENKHSDILFDTLISVTKITKEHYLFNIACEAILNNNPLNNTERFNLAYHYSEVGKNDLSYLHYKFLTKVDSKSSAYWNNLGVAAYSLNLKAKAISSYFQASKMDNTLAMSNIAYEYISQGFIKDAENICNKALLIKDYDKSVAGALSSINGKIKHEDSEEEKIIERANEKKIVMLKLANSLVQPIITSITSNWKHPNCNLEIKVSGNEFRALGIYEKSYSNILSSLLNQSESIGNPQMVKYKILIEGMVIGHFIKADYYDCKEIETTEEMKKSKKDLLMMINDDLTQIIGFKLNDYDKFIELNVQNVIS